MRILIEDQDLVSMTSNVFSDAEFAALYLSQIAVDWTLTGGKDNAKDAAMNDTRMRTVAKQMAKGLLGPGDEIRFHFDGMDCMVSILEDAGKHTGPPWMNRYAFGPLHKDMVTMGFENIGWPNMVPEAPRWLGVGHSPDGEQY